MMTLRAGLIGLGNIGRHHARVLRELEGVHLVAVADPAGDPFNVAGGLTVGRDVEELITQGIDIAVVAVPTAHHEDVALALAHSGVHTLVEKPLAGSPSSACRIRDAFAAAGLVGAVGHLERFNPSVRSLHQRLSEGHLGEVHQIMTRRQSPFPARVADVGVILDLATHDLDLTTFISGSGYRSIDARCAHRSGRKHEDAVVAVGDLYDGTITNHIVNWLSPVKERNIHVLGERGTLLADTITGDLTFFANGSVTTSWDAIATFRGVSEGDVIRYAIPKPEPLHTELGAFRDAVLGKKSDCPIVTMAEGAQTVQQAINMQASARRKKRDFGRTVELPTREQELHVLTSPARTIWANMTAARPS